jgi:phosphate-selective porin
MMPRRLCAFAIALAGISVCRAQSSRTAAEPGLRAGYDDGFFVGTADGRQELHLGGLFQVEARVYQADRARDSQFALRKARFEIEGRFEDQWVFLLEPKFQGDEAGLDEAWAGADLGFGELQFGRIKVPFGLEENRSRRWIDLPRRSIVKSFSPEEDLGIAFKTGGRSKGHEFGISLTNGTGDAELGSSKDVAARFMWRPWFDAADRSLQNLGIGLAGTHGRQRQDLSGHTLINEAAAPIFDYLGGTWLDGARQRVGAEFEWYRGPWLVYGDWFFMRQEMSGTSGSDEIDFRGGEVTVTRSLTGEAKTPSGLQPLHPIGEDGGSGAWAVAARYSELRLDSRLSTLGMVQPAGNPGTVRTVSVGLNWYPTNHAVLRNAWVQTFYEDPIDLDGSLRRSEGALLLQFQLHF